METGVSIGFAIAFITAFVIGVVLGVLGCAGAIKFVEWMRGKALFFTPWPRVRSGIEPRNSTWQNPTYEMENPNSKQQKQNQTVSQPSRETEHSSSLLMVLDKGPHGNTKTLVEVYEEVEEPINPEEASLGAFPPHQAQPYAVHDFADDKPPDIEASKPVKYKKTPKSKVKKDANDTTTTKREQSARKNSSSAQKPTMLSKMKPQIAHKPPMLASPVHQGAMNCDPGGAYSELDQKMSYASLEPHTGLNTVTRDNFMSESYGHLHH